MANIHGFSFSIVNFCSGKTKHINIRCTDIFCIFYILWSELVTDIGKKINYRNDHSLSEFLPVTSSCFKGPPLLPYHIFINILNCKYWFKKKIKIYICMLGYSSDNCPDIYSKDYLCCTVKSTLTLEVNYIVE